MNFNQLEEKVLALQKRLDEICLDGKTLNVDNIKAKSVIVSNPKCTHSILIDAGTSHCGIWMNGLPTHSSVSIYVTNSEGAVMGVCGPKNSIKKSKLNALDVCMSYQGQGVIQIVDEENKAFYITGKENEKTSFWQTYLAGI